MDPLSALGTKYHTDKAPWCHNYTPVYDFLLSPIRETTKKVLEIGVFGGASCSMWHEYFPNATIWGMDFKDYGEVMKEREFPRFKFILGDAGTRSSIERIRNEVGTGIDVIIDDGSHFPADVRAAYYGLFPLLRDGGFYFIEDMAPLSNAHALWWIRADGNNRGEWREEQVRSAIEANRF